MMLVVKAVEWAEVFVIASHDLLFIRDLALSHKSIACHMR